MRIALLHYSFPPVIGGVERILAEHALLFAGNGHEVTAICGSGEAPETRFGSPLHDLHSAVRLVSIPVLSASHPEVKEVQAAIHDGKTDTAFETLRENVKQQLRPLLAAQDLVIFHNVCTMPFHMALTGALWQLADELPDTRFICWVHDLAAVNPDYSIPRIPPWDFLRRAHERYEYVAISELRQRQLSELTGLSPEHCRVIPNGLDPIAELGLTQNVERLARALHLLERDLVLVQPTRLLRRKNIELSLNVAARLKTAGKSVCLLITGAPDPHNTASQQYADQLRALRSDLNLQDDCFFLGELFDVSSADVSSLYRVADALFFPSHQEGFGLPIIEAALHRLPAFCTDVEPLRHLPGAQPFSRTATPSEIAATIIHRMQGWPANSPRKVVVQNYAWSAIYRNFLAPLLSGTKNS